MAKKARTVQINPFDPFVSEQRALEDFMKAAKAFDKKHNRSKATATRQLQKEGMLTRSGKLSRNYGG